MDTHKVVDICCLQMRTRGFVFMTCTRITPMNEDSRDGYHTYPGKLRLVRLKKWSLIVDMVHRKGHASALE